MQTQPLQTVAFRSVRIGHYWPSNPLSGLGAAKYGNHWNPQGIPAIYCSLRQDTTVLEATLTRLGHDTLDLSRYPQVLFAIQVVLSKVVDLSLPEIQAALAVNIQDLVQENWHEKLDTGQTPKSHHVVEKLLKLGVEGILVPSRHDPKVNNLVVYPRNLQAESSISEIA